jgi:single-stranded DNA-binding protein
MNKVTIYGRIGKIEAESLKINGEEVRKLKFSIADKVDKNTTVWHSVVAWRGLANTIEKYCKKGDRLVVNGQINSFKTNEGKEIHYITCSDVAFVETAQDSEQQNPF